MIWTAQAECRVITNVAPASARLWSHPTEDFKKDYEQVWLRINDHPKSDNIGEVTYEVSVK